MKTKKKALLLALCALLLVSGSIFGTYAYLQSQDSVTNTFTMGKVNITLDETDVDVYGVKDGTTRVKANAYKLVPGHTYTKDPIVHLTAGSEDSYLFVKITNGIAELESNATGYVSIAAQITANGWTALTNGSNIYYKKAETNLAAADYKVFESFRIDEDLTDLTAQTAADVVVNAYAVQADGFATAGAAWSATFGK